jgi:hypothetical protein
MPLNQTEGHSQADKYAIQTDEFEGTVRVRDNRALEDESYLSVGFGFRACRNGEWAVAAYGRDLDRATRAWRLPTAAWLHAC